MFVRCIGGCHHNEIIRLEGGAKSIILMKMVNHVIMHPEDGYQPSIVDSNVEKINYTLRFIEDVPFLAPESMSDKQALRRAVMY